MRDYETGLDRVYITPYKGYLSLFELNYYLTAHVLVGRER